jgi:hypothetical protein
MQMYAASQFWPLRAACLQRVCPRSGAHRDVFGRTGYAQSMQLAAATFAQSDNTATTSVTSYNRERFVVVSLIRKRSYTASSVAVAAIRDTRSHAFTENIDRYSRTTYSCIRVVMVARNTRLKSLFAAAHATIRFNFETPSKLAKAGEIGNSPCVLLRLGYARNRNVAGM